MVIALILLFGAGILTSIELLAVKKRRELNTAISFVVGKEKENARSHTFLESSSMGLGASALSIYDIYSACDNHEQVLDTLEHRFNQMMGDDATTLDWYTKVEQLSASGPNAMGTYISNYAGQAGENAALKMFENSGLKAELFESRIHPNEDIRVFDNDGNFTDYSVKSYGDVSDFKAIVSDHSSSSHYVVNSELYETMSASGDIDEFSRQGIEILDGNFSNDAAREMADNAFDGISDAGDMSDNVPIVALALFGVKTVRNVVQLAKGRQSGYETSVNVGGDFIRIGVSGACAAGGAKLGGIIGTFISPGVGTIVGGGIGLVVGAIAGSSIVNFLKERIKWGKIINAIDAIGQQYESGLINIKHAVQFQLLGMESLQISSDKEIKLKTKYSAELSAYSRRNTNIPAVLTHIHSRMLISEIKRVKRASSIFCSEIHNLCVKAAIKMAGGKTEKVDRIKERLLGELLSANSETLLAEYELDPTTRQLLEGYHSQITKAPNHPYKFQHDSKEIVQGIALRSFRDAQVKPKVSFSIVNPFVLILILSILGICGYMFFKIIFR